MMYTHSQMTCSWYTNTPTHWQWQVTYTPTHWQVTPTHTLTSDINTPTYWQVTYTNTHWQVTYTNTPTHWQIHKHTVVLIDWLMIAYIALFSALLSRLTALVCGSAWVTSFIARLCMSLWYVCVCHFFAVIFNILHLEVVYDSMSMRLFYWYLHYIHDLILYLRIMYYNLYCVLVSFMQLSGKFLCYSY